MSRHTASRRTAIALCVALLALLVVAMARAVMLAGTALRGLEPHTGDGHRRVIGRGQVKFDGLGPERWALRFRREHELTRRLLRRLHRQRYVLLHDPEVTEAIELAATVYGDGPLLWRIARRESNYQAGARNPASSATGLFQFLDTTWAHTPFARFDRSSAYANALAAGWMIENGHSSAWSPLP
jgi:hypothetical protein